ncbi:MAG: hypothetical protein ACWGNB_08675 [Thiogranum sp.]
MTEDKKPLRDWKPKPLPADHEIYTTAFVVGGKRLIGQKTIGGKRLISLKARRRTQTDD